MAKNSIPQEIVDNHLSIYIEIFLFKIDLMLGLVKLLKLGIKLY